MKVDWLWLGVGVVFALFVLPMVTGFISQRKTPKQAQQ